MTCKGPSSCTNLQVCGPGCPDPPLPVEGKISTSQSPAESGPVQAAAFPKGQPEVETLRLEGKKHGKDVEEPEWKEE